MLEMDKPGIVETDWAEAVEDLGVPAKLWDQVLATEFDLPPGKTLTEAFLLLMRDWVQDGGERYDYVRRYGMSDRKYIYYLLAQALEDTEESEDVLEGADDAIERQWQKALDDFNRDNLSGLMN
jgi:hypothetical protein